MILERIKEFIDYRNISISAFEKSLGMSNASFSKCLKSGKGIGTDKLENILTIYSEISPDWLLTGEGEMIVDTLRDRLSYVLLLIGTDRAAHYLCVDRFDLVNYCNGGEKPVVTINFNRLLEKYPFNPKWLIEGEGDKFLYGSQEENEKNIRHLIEEEETEERLKEIEKHFNPLPEAKPVTSPSEGIPLIPISAMAGAFAGEQTVLEYECERFIVPIFKGADFLINVRGNSMYPKYNSGDIVACKRVPLKDIFFQWNKVYVLDTDQGPLVKRIKPGFDENHILIVSDNTDYEPFELHLNSIYNVALVLGVIRLE